MTKAASKVANAASDVGRKISDFEGGELPMITRSGKNATQFDTTLEYLQDIFGLPRFIENILNNDTETLNEIIPPALQRAKPVRNLVFGGGMLQPHLAFGKIKWTANIFSLWCWVTGEVQPFTCKCKTCHDRKVYPACVKWPAGNIKEAIERKSRKLACVNCIYNESATLCSLYTSTLKPRSKAKKLAEESAEQKPEQEPEQKPEQEAKHKLFKAMA